MRKHATRYLTAFSLAAFLALPVWARGDSATVTVANPTTIAGKQLAPGTYKLEALPGQNHLKVVDTSSRKTVADVPCQWFQLKTASSTTEVIVSNHTVTEVDFGGKTQAVKFD